MSLAARALAAAVGGALAIASCGADPAADAGEGPDDRLSVLAAFYPLQFAAERVGGERVEVTNLTAPGSEPHDLELTPQDVARISKADLVVLLEGFQPAVDEAAAGEAADAAYDVRDDARLDLTVAGHPEDSSEDQAGTEGQAGTEDHAGAEATDPHFWLDPLRLADVSDALADRLGELDAEGAGTYRANAADLRKDLESLDAEMSAALAGCATREIVTSHSAFGYLAERYGFTQVSVSGLSPGDEPSGADLAKLADFVAGHGVTTVYTETLVSSDLADTVAAESGARTAVLDPLEGLGDDRAGRDGRDYLDVMRANLTELLAGQSCP